MNMDPLLSNFAIPILLIFPGTIVVSRLLKRNVLNPMSIIAGSLFWYATLIFPAVILASFTTYVDYYFYAFWICSVLILLLYALSAIRDFSKIRARTHFHIDYIQLPILIFVITESIFIALSTIYHPIYNEFDALAYYLPLAKGITKTGGLFYNPYFLSDIFVARPPLVPLSYAATLCLFGEESFRSIPFVFYALTLVAVYSIAKEIFGGRTEIPIISTAVFSSLPVVLVVLSRYSLYQEPALMFFTSASFLFAYIALRRNEKRWYLLLGLSSGLALMTKETGYVAFVIASCMLSLGFRSRLKSVIVGIFPPTALYFFFFAVDLQSGPPSPYVTFQQVSVTCLIAIVALLIIAYNHNWFSRSSEKSENHGRHRTFYKFVCFLTVFIPVGLFPYLRNFLMFHTPSVLWFIPAKLPSFYPLGPQFNYSPIVYFRWDILLISIALGGMYFLPKIVSLLRTFYEDNKPLIALLIWVGILVADWSFFYKCSFVGSEIRRLLVFAPVFSIITAYGLHEILRFLKWRSKYYVVYASIFCAVVLWFEMTFQLSQWSYNGVRYNIEEKQPLLDINHLLLSIGSVMILAILSRTRAHDFLLALKSSVSTFLKISACALSNTFGKIPVFLLIGVVVASLMPSYLIVRRAQEATLVNWSITNYGKRALYSEWEMGMAEVVEYLIAKTNGSDTILSFGVFTRYIAYLADRSVIDISSVDGLLFVLRNLNYSDPEKIDGLALYNINYVLFPNEDNYAVYDRYVNYSYHMPILALPQNSVNFLLTKRFKYWNFYKVLSSKDVLWQCNTSYITPAYPPYVFVERADSAVTAHITVPDGEKQYFRLETILPPLKIDQSKDIYISLKYRLTGEVESGSLGIPYVELYSGDNRVYYTSFKVPYNSNMTALQILVPKEKLNIFRESSTLRLMIFTQNKGNYTWSVEDLAMVSS